MRSTRLLLVGAVLSPLAACRGGGLPPVPVTLPPSPSAGIEKGCVRFSAALPRSLDVGEVVAKRRRTDPADLRLAAYGDPPIVLRCGAPNDPTYKAGQPVLTIEGVQWFAHERKDDVVFSLPKAFVNIEVTMPRAYDAQLLALLSDPAKAAQPL